MSESLITSSSRDKIKARYVVIKLLFHESKHDWPVESSGYRIKCWNYGTIRIGFRAGIFPIGCQSSADYGHNAHNSSNFFPPAPKSWSNTPVYEISVYAVELRPVIVEHIQYKSVNTIKHSNLS